HKVMSDNYTLLKNVISKQQKPVYVEKDNNGNLPWINPGTENFVIATTYYLLKKDRSKLEEQGIEGLMEKGYFNTIINLNKVSNEYKNQYCLTDTIVEKNITLYVW